MEVPKETLLNFLDKNVTYVWQTYNDNTTSMETLFEHGHNIIFGKDGTKEVDSVSKISINLGKIWINEEEILSYENPLIEFWTYEEYKSYAQTVDNNLMEMLIAGEPDLIEEDIISWKMDTAQLLDFIKAGGKISKNTFWEDSQFVIDGMDSFAIEILNEKN